MDDLLHNGYRLEKLDPLFKQEGLEVDRIIVSILSGRGKDLMQMQDREVECEYFIPNLRYSVYGKPTLPLYRRGQRSGPQPGAGSAAFHQSDPAPTSIPGSSRGSAPTQSAISPWRRSKTPLSILTVLEARYQETFSTSLTLKRLGEAIFTPRLPDRGAHIHYDFNVAASAYISDDILLMKRLRKERDDI